MQGLSYASESKYLSFDRKNLGKSRINRRVFFGHPRHQGTLRPAIQFLPKRRQRFRRTNGVDFHPAVPQIPGESGQLQLLSQLSRKKSVAHTLHEPAYQISRSFAGRDSFAHLGSKLNPQTANFNRRRKGAEEESAMIQVG